MAIETHVSEMQLVDVTSTGEIVDRNRSTIGTIMTTSKENRIIPGTENANTSGWPTIKQYLVREASSGFKLVHLDQTYIITVKET